MDKESVDIVRWEAEQAYVRYSLLKDACLKAEAEYIKKLNKFRNFDHQLAMTDGRLKVIPPSQKKEKKQAELTLLQIQDIANILGIKITEEEDEEIKAMESEEPEDETET